MTRLAAMLAILVLAACEPIPAATAVTGSTPTGGDVLGRPPDVSEEACATARAIAERMMTARQVGVPREQVLIRAQDVDHAELRALAESIAVAAYDQPVQASDEARARAIATFADRVEVGCHDA